MEATEMGTKSHNMWNPRKGGFRAAMFVFVMSALENVGFVANMLSLVLYFMLVMHFDLSGSSTTVTNFMGTTFLLTIVGGFVSDTYMTRLNTILFFAIFEIMGYVVLTIQAQYKHLQPEATCMLCKLDGGNARLFYLSLCLLAIGFGGTRGCIAAFGADQFDRDHPKERKQLASFFNWLLLSVTLGAALGVTVIVWISTEKKRWSLAFFISMLLALLSFLVVAVGRPFYRTRVPGRSPLTRVLQVIVVAGKNRNLSLPETSEELYDQVYEKDGKIGDEEKIPHTDQLRFLDKAAVVEKGSTPEAWKVCTVTQVEEVKILIKMLPILLSTIIMNTCLAQLQTFSIQQGYIMDLHLGSFRIPPASIPVIPLLCMSLLIPLYEIIFLPIARRITGHPTGITHLQRVGVGLVLSAVSMAAAGIIEVKRRNAFNHHFKQISVFWLTFQFCIFGIADMFTFVGLLEFFYSEAPTGMRSLATSFSFLSMSFGYFLSTAFVHAVDAITRRATQRRQGWLHGLDLNANNLDRFYWFLAVLSCINFGVYVLCAKWYKYRGSVLGHINDTHQDSKAEVDVNGNKGSSEEGNACSERRKSGEVLLADQSLCVDDDDANETNKGKEEGIGGDESRAENGEVIIVDQSLCADDENENNEGNESTTLSDKEAAQSVE